MPSRKLAKQFEKTASALDALRHEVAAPDFAKDPVLFAREALGLELDPWQAGVLASEGKRDLLNCSRQAGKSTTAAVLALHEAMYRPDSLTLLVSPSQRQSGELFRKVIEYRESLASPPVLTEDNRLSMAVSGGGRVVSLPGSEATIRGFSSVTLLIEDESARVEDELYLAVRPMLAVNNGRLVLMSTPFGKRGHFWNTWSSDNEWNRVRVPATDVPRISEAFLEEEKRSMPRAWFVSEYMCEFVDSVDQVFSTDLVNAALSDEFEPFFTEEK